MRYEPNQKHVRNSLIALRDPMDHPLDRWCVLMTAPSRTYIDPPDSLRQADEALIRLRASLSALGIAYLLGDRQAIVRGLSVAIGHGEEIVTNLRKAHDRSTRT